MGIKFFFACLALIVVLQLGIDLYEYQFSKYTCETSTNTEKVNYSTEMSEWQIFTLAIIDIESDGNSKTVSNKNAVGILQITPIYVEEVNRIQSYSYYTLNDRYDINKSLEMFEITNFYKNPDRNINLAIKIHNPNAPYSYKEKILKRMDDIRAGILVNEELKKTVCRYN